MAELFDLERSVGIYSLYFETGAETLREILRSVARCLDQLLPLEVSRRIDREGSTAARGADGRLRAVRHPELEAARAGLARIDVLRLFLREEHGGLGLPLVFYYLVVQLCARYDASLALTLLVHGNAMYALERFGSEGQRRRWLPALAAGERLATIAFTEPEAGSDAGAIRTRAARAECGDGWVLEGTKCWITHGGDADLMIVSARTGELALGLRGVSAFLVEREADGVELVGLEEKTGLGGSPTAALALPAIALPGDRLLGALGQGGAVMLSGVGMTRVAIAAQALGIGKRAFEAAARFALERVQGGCRIVEHDAVRARLAEMALALFAIENLVCWDARLEARGDWHVREMSIAKYYASEALQELTQRAIGVHGGCGCARCCEVERCRREAVALPLFGGTSEIQWFIIARELADDERAGTGYRRRDGALCAELAARAAGSPRLAALAARLADAVETLWRCAERVAALEPELRAPCERELAELATASAVAQALLWQATAAGAGALEHELAAAALDRLGERAATTVAAIASGDPRRELKRLVREQLE